MTLCYRRNEESKKWLLELIEQVAVEILSASKGWRPTTL